MGCQTLANKHLSLSTITVGKNWQFLGHFGIRTQDLSVTTLLIYLVNDRSGGSNPTWGNIFSCPKNCSFFLLCNVSRGVLVVNKVWLILARWFLSQITFLYYCTIQLRSQRLAKIPPGNFRSRKERKRRASSLENSPFKYWPHSLGGSQIISTFFCCWNRASVALG